MGKLINIDNGGTLTDFCVLDGERVLYTKTLTTPHDLSQCFFEGLKKISDLLYGIDDVGRLLRETTCIRYSTTQGTNALIERKGPRIGLIVGRNDEIAGLRATASMRELFAAIVGDRVVRVDAGLSAADLDRDVTAAVNEVTAAGANRIVIGLFGSDVEAREQALRRVVLRCYPSHLLGAVPVTFASEIADDPEPVRRIWTALFNAFLHPAMERFLYSADHRLKQHRNRSPLLVFRNDGGSARVAKTIALKTYSSGPRGGLEAARVLAEHYRLTKVLSCDVGGTTTDVACIEGSTVAQASRGDVESVPVSIALSQVQSIGVGGSSIIRIVKGSVRIGPESVGAAPGPVCFARGGTDATMTDVALVAQLLDPTTYCGGEIALDVSRARAAVETQLAATLGTSLERAIAAVEDAWVERIVAVLRQVSAPAPDTTLLGFGGAGALVLTRIAGAIGLRQALVPGLSAVFSAYGVGFSDLSQHYHATVRPVTDAAAGAVWARLRARAERDMFAEGAALEHCIIDAALTHTVGDIDTRYRYAPGDPLPRAIAGVAQAQLSLRVSKPMPHFVLGAAELELERPALASGTRRILIGGAALDVGVYRFEDLSPGASAAGPAIVEERFFTARIDAGWRFTLTGNCDLLLTRDGNI